MFNKPNLFPKTAEPVAGRSSRPVGATSTSAAGAPSVTGGSASALPSSPQPDTTVSTPRQAVASDLKGADGAAEATETAAGGSRLIVGPDVKLKGAEILDCDTLVVEGRVEATMDSRVIRIAEAGAFSGKVGIDIAEIHGVFEGELTARQQLRIHSTGRVSGKIRYGRILIEEGGEVSGDVQPLATATKEGYKPQERVSALDVKPLSAVNA
ncbi:polymer-forming cytoskeletal protein [Azoarcus sp. L1K30]|uniref:bactofilin family protein n=1 Tax=Azoarcus sp. L1K30 TaxID=2820277 RepID=UPI001B82168D|nr:polymer-forming cytoskeletal protein [Azoarcus sp. L1K30]MBR0568543.1 polymer-forming cytoskeletal protein [Azoarcus sp. L1K30]